MDKQNQKRIQMKDKKKIELWEDWADFARDLHGFSHQHFWSKSAHQIYVDSFVGSFTNLK